MTRLLSQIGHFEESLVCGQNDTDYARRFVGGEEIWTLDDFLRFNRDALSEGTSTFSGVDIWLNETRDLITRSERCGEICVYDFPSEFKLDISFREWVGEENHEKIYPA